MNDKPVIQNVADITDPKTGKSFRQMNSEQTHKFSIGDLVEIRDGAERLYIKELTRDCDQTPMYSLGKFEGPGVLYDWPGFVEEDLVLVKAFGTTFTFGDRLKEIKIDLASIATRMNDDESHEVAELAQEAIGTVNSLLLKMKHTGINDMDWEWEPSDEE